MIHALGGIERRSEMGHNNYSRFSSKFNKQNENLQNKVSGETVENVQVSNEPTQLVEPEPQIAIENRIVKGTVVDCEKLYVRSEPTRDSDPLLVIEKGDLLDVNLTESTEGDFYKVSTLNVEGYCMKKFISIE